LINKLITNNLFLLILLSSIWGSAFIAIKIAVQTINPISIVALRLTIASIILLTFFIIKGYKFNFTLKTYMYIFLISLFGNVIPFYLISWSEIFIDSNLAGLLLSIAPIFALISSHFLTSDDKFTLMKFLATIFGFIGIIILLGFDNLKLVFQGDYLLILPKIAVIIAAFGYVISSIFAYNLKKINTISLTTMVLIFASLMSLPFMLIYEINNFSIPDNKSIIAVIYLGIMPTATAYLLRFYIISKAGPIFLSYVAYLIPIFAIFWGVILLNENINALTMFAMIFIFAGIYFGQKEQNSNVINNLERHKQS
tara:strand:+ start:2156 stop:3088 length:933 start_codon:yes stop_codon:yes gene_type:complete